MNLTDRFWAKVVVTADDECWPWMGAVTGAGYGHLWDGDSSQILAHRLSVELARGPIPSGLVVDHLCHNRICVNPGHLEVVAHRENIMRGESPTIGLHLAGTCARGHDLATEASRRKNGSVGYCRACRREAYAALPPQELERRRAASRARAARLYGYRSVA